MRNRAFMALPLLASLWVAALASDANDGANNELTNCIQALANARQTTAAERARLARDLATCRDKQAEQEDTLSGLVKQAERCEAGKEQLKTALNTLQGDLTRARVATQACQSLHRQQAQDLADLKAQDAKRIARLQHELQQAQAQAAQARRQLEQSQADRERLEKTLADLKAQDAQRLTQLQHALQQAQAQAAQARKQLDRNQADRERVTQALASCSTKLDSAHAAIQRLRSEHAQLQQALADTRQGMRSCQQEKAQIAAALEDSRKSSADMKLGLSEAEGENKRLSDQLSSVRGAWEHCQALYDGLESEAAGIRHEKDTCQHRLAAIEADLAALRARVPKAEGGDLELQDLKAAATQASEALTQAFKAKHRRKAAADADANYAKARAALANLQFQIARSEGGSGIYRVHRHDTLASIARWYFGQSGTWQPLYEANRHVLQNPNRLIPGVTLIIP